MVRRPAGRWEVRESVLTQAGPRSRSLVGFRVLTSDALDRAEARATQPFDRDGVLAAAYRVGAPVEEPRADAAARALVSEAAAGRLPSPGLRQLLADQLCDAGEALQLQTGDSITDWIGASPARRGEALRDLLGLGDRLPSPDRTRLAFPRLRSDHLVDG